METCQNVKVFHSPDDSASLRVLETKDGVRLDFIDYELDLYQSWTVSDRKLINFETGSLSAARHEDLKEQELE